MIGSYETVISIGAAALGVICVVALGVLVIAFTAVGVSKVVLRIMKGPLDGRIAARYSPDEIRLKDLTANSFGRESAGVWQLRGNGGLVLTGKQLHFFMFLTNSDLCVPLDAITEIAITKSHLGKATIYDLLKVHFSEDGKRDSIAWYLADPKAWKQSIEALQTGRPLN